MRSQVQTAGDRLHQLKKDVADLLRNFAELAMLRELVEQKEAALRSKLASDKKSTTALPTNSGDPSDHHRPTG